LLLWGIAVFSHCGNNDRRIEAETAGVNSRVPPRESCWVIHSKETKSLYDGNDDKFEGSDNLKPSDISKISILSHVEVRAMSRRKSTQKLHVWSKKCTSSNRAWRWMLRHSEYASGTGDSIPHRLPRISDRYASAVPGHSCVLTPKISTRCQNISLLCVSYNVSSNHRRQHWTPTLSENII
jgi:hypothetical protein